MAETEAELLDYEEEEETAETTAAEAADAPAKKDVKGTYVSIHSSACNFLSNILCLSFMVLHLWFDYLVFLCIHVSIYN